MKFSLFGILFIALSCLSTTSYAKCTASTDKLCVMEETKRVAATIENDSWRDKAYRELAKSFTYEGYEDKAIALIADIKNADTKAMTIRGIGFAAADNKWEDKTRYDTLFKKLATAAEKIDHPPSHAIAYTYISMAQAFANDDAGAMATAATIQNDALRNKAFGEAGEIQAERGDFNTAMASIKRIGSSSYRNKAYTNVANIFAKQGQLDYAYNCAQNIENSYLKSQVLQAITNYGNDEETLSSKRR